MPDSPHHTTMHQISSTIRVLLVLLIGSLLTVGLAAQFDMPVQAVVQARPADPPLAPEDQAILDQVAALLGSGQQLRVQQTTTGARFVDLDGTFRAVLLAQTAADGTLVQRCITTLEEARLFLSGDDPATAAQLAGRAVAHDDHTEAATLRPLPAVSSQITIVNLDSPNTGFNDPTPAPPVGGNPGTTVGAQRLWAFEYAAEIWAGSLQTTVPIQIGAGFQSLSCGPSSGVLGSAGPIDVFRDFAGSGSAPGALRDNTWYPVALANKLAGRDLDPQSYDVEAIFNSDLGTPGCLENSFWYYGLDGQQGPGGIDLVTVLLHEFAHGLGFLSLVSTNSSTAGQNFFPNSSFYPNDAPGASDDVWNTFLFDRSLNRPWSELVPLQRSFSITNTGQLVWDGPAIRAVAPGFLRSSPVFTITNPLALAGTYPLGEATFGPAMPAVPLNGSISAGIDPADLEGFSISDGCSPLLNPAAVNGTIVVLDLGSCADTTKAHNAQEAGARALLLADTLDNETPPEIFGDDPTIGIPVFGITRSLAEQLRTAIADSGAGGILGRDLSSLIGADTQGRVQMYAVNPIRPGSSVSHFDIAAAPNLLMEPAINNDLDQSLDLTDELMRDIGWFPDTNFNAVDDRSELKLSVTQEITPGGRLQSGDIVTLTISVRNNGTLGSSAVRLSNIFPSELISVTWSAVYSGDATGAGSGEGNIDTTLSLPPNSTAVFTVQAEIAVTNQVDLINTAQISSLGTELDGDERDNRASVIIFLSSYRYLLPALDAAIE